MLMYSLVLKFTQVQKPTVKAVCSLLVMCTVAAEKRKRTDNGFPRKMGESIGES